jgi:ferric-dicitrate binding protein FerR (iron transport regulator)
MAAAIAFSAAFASSRPRESSQLAEAETEQRRRVLRRRYTVGAAAVVALALALCLLMHYLHVYRERKQQGTVQHKNQWPYSEGQRPSLQRAAAPRN